MAYANPIEEWFFTAPLEDIAVRRGDPLGMRAVAEEMAEVLAPGLSNRTLDGRWLSIMCWALDQGYYAWLAHGVIKDDDAVVSRQAARELYSWVRPLEMLWLARTVEATDDKGKGRQLPGVRAVRRWVGEALAELAKVVVAPAAHRAAIEQRTRMMKRTPDSRGMAGLGSSLRR